MIKRKCGGIYMIKHKDGKYYIGLSLDVFTRWQSHYTLLKLNKHHSPKLQELFNKSNPSDFTYHILEYVSKDYVRQYSGEKGKLLDKLFQDILRQLEKDWMNKLDRDMSLNKNNKNFK